jgi:hypothetical protein
MKTEAFRAGVCVMQMYEGPTKVENVDAGRKWGIK